MNVDIKFRNLQPSAALRAYALRRIRTHLEPHGGAVEAVVLRFYDVNGPRGGIDKRCQVQVRGPMLDASIDELGHDLYAAADVAVKRAARAVERRTGRLRRWR